jgi:hypothetical protein
MVNSERRIRASQLSILNSLFSQLAAPFRVSGSIDKPGCGLKLAPMWKLVVLSALVLFVVVGCHRNSPPTVPLLDGPQMVQRVDSVRLRAYSFDPDSDSLSYVFDWGDGTQSGWVGPEPSGADCGLAHFYPDTGVYGARAKSKDAAHETGWSDTSFIHVGEYGPYVPHRPSGPDTVPVGDSATFVTAAGHPLQKHVAFQFDWGDTVGEWSGFIRAGEFFPARHAFTRGGMMLVRARARDTLEHVSDWSKPESVTVVDTFRFK